MLACRLCLAFGIEDPEQWLEDCPRRVLNVWRAFASADRWGDERRLAAVATITLKQLLSAKIDKDHRQSVLESIDKIAERYLPADLRFEADEKTVQLDESILQVMNRGGGSVLNTPTYSAEIEIDPWPQR